MSGSTFRRRLVCSGLGLILIAGCGEGEVAPPSADQNMVLARTALVTTVAAAQSMVGSEPSATPIEPTIVANTEVMGGEEAVAGEEAAESEEAVAGEEAAGGEKAAESEEAVAGEEAAGGEEAAESEEAVAGEEAAGSEKAAGEEEVAESEEATTSEGDGADKKAAEEAAKKAAREAAKKERAALKSKGRGIYMSKCKSCHGASGAADTGIGKKTGMASWKTSGWKRKWPVSKIERIVKNGKGGTKMKAFSGKLSGEEIKAVSVYANSLGR